VWNVSADQRAGGGWSAYGPGEPDAVPPFVVALARANAGTGVTRARMVTTTLGRAEAWASGGELRLSAAPTERQVILVSLDGDFVGRAASVPFGAEPPRGTNLLLIYDPVAARIVSWGIRPAPPAAPLSTLGTVGEIDPAGLR